MLNRTEVENDIIRNLCIFKEYTKSNSKLNRTTNNVDAEDFIKDLLNLCLDLELDNSNRLEKNYPGIDLFSECDSLCVQVTSDNTINKIESTFSTFLLKKYYKKYEELIIFIIGEKKRYQNLPENKKFKLKIMDINDLICEICHKNLRKLKEINEFLKKEILLFCGTSTDFIIKHKKAIDMKNGDRYIKWFCEYVEISEDNFQKEDLECFLNKLKNITLNKRKFIKEALKLGKNNSNEYMSFDIEDLKSVMLLSSLYDILRSLEEDNIIENRDEYYPDPIYIFRNVKNVENINWALFVRFCDENNILLDDIIVNLDFSILDN